MDEVACDIFAAAQGRKWTPVPWQGANSYTLRSDDGTTILQFRDPNETLAPDIVSLAMTVHPTLVPRTEYLGPLTGYPSVCVWRMGSMPGDPYLFHVGGLNAQQISTTVLDLARHVMLKPLVLRRLYNLTWFQRFFAASWKHPQLDADFQASRYTTALEKLLTALPTDFHATIHDVVNNLDSIIHLPLVLTHHDLSCGNMLIDPQTGQLTGIIDWADASIEPFGLALWGLQDVIGRRGADGHSYLFDAKANRSLFCGAFLDEVCFTGDTLSLERARSLGVLLRYGFLWDSDPQARIPAK